MTPKQPQKHATEAERAQREDRAPEGAPKTETPEDPAMPPVSRDEPTDHWDDLPPGVEAPVEPRPPVYSHVPRRPDYAVEARDREHTTP